MGVATGYAASLCKKYNTNPRDIYINYLKELKNLVKNGERPQGVKKITVEYK
jgi:hypothetical protein